MLLDVNSSDTNFRELVFFQILEYICKRRINKYLEATGKKEIKWKYLF